MRPPEPKSAAAISTSAQTNDPGTRDCHFQNVVHGQELPLSRCVSKDLLSRSDLTLRWVPGHEEIEGNEQADADAKLAASGTPVQYGSFRRRCDGLSCQSVESQASIQQGSHDACGRTLA